MLTIQFIQSIQNYCMILTKSHLLTFQQNDFSYFKFIIIFNMLHIFQQVKLQKSNVISITQQIAIKFEQIFIINNNYHY